MFFSVIILFLLSLINYAELKFCKENNCENGICFEPNLCICHPGFELSSKNNCTPKCSDGCLNGVCIEPEICECLEGYVEVTGSYNKCEQEFDILTEETTIEGEGNFNNYNYITSNFVEEKRFEIDDNSTESNIEDSADYELINDDEFNKWIAINKYEKGNYTNANIEEKRFEVESAEIDEISALNNSKCQIKTINIFFDFRSCECQDGYSLRFNATKFAECVPLCNGSENGCINGYCVGPNICLCLKNYQQNFQNELECLPRSLDLSDRWTIFTQTYLTTLIILAGFIFIAMYFLRKFAQDGKSKVKKGRNLVAIQQTRV